MQKIAARTGAVIDPADTTWYRSPFPITVGDMPLDIGDARLGGYRFHPDSQLADAFGHAAPFFADVDGDGKRDLIVGSYAGRFRLYKNVGSPAAPKFSKDFTWIKAGDEIAGVLIYCCVAVGPQMADLDGDGILDLSSGSYQPGTVYWWRGLGKGRFADRQLLTTGSGIPIVPHLESLDMRETDSFMSNVAYGDFYGTGRPDMVLGDFLGELFLLRNNGTPQRYSTGALPTSHQPSFSFEYQKPRDIRINGERALPNEFHAAPAVADWDGDGLLDILAGTEYGRVYWFRNTGTKTKPVFASRVMLIDRGAGVEQWVEPGQLPPRGIRSQINVVDYNGDGKLDILVGDWTYTMSPRANLTAEERAKVKILRDSLAALDRKVGFTFVNWRHKWPGYGDMPAFEDNRPENRPLLEITNQLTAQLAPYLEPCEVKPGVMAKPDDPWGHMRAGGHVWVFLRK